LLLDNEREEAASYRAAANLLRSSRVVIELEIDRLRRAAQDEGSRLIQLSAPLRDIPTLSTD